MPNSARAIIFCRLTRKTKRQIEKFAEDLRKAAPGIGEHGLTEEEFWASGLFQGAVERLRGQAAATMDVKKAFMKDILDHLKRENQIEDWVFVGAAERHDYEIKMPGGRVSIVEAKGCLDGNNTNIFERPLHADEFIIWSLCQNPGADPRKNAMSGLHTRLSAEMIHRKQKVDGVVIWDMVCGTPGRPCPKLILNPERATSVAGRRVPPPCLYLFPRSIADARNNPRPPIAKLSEVRLLKALCDTFKGESSDVVEVHVEARMVDADIQRRTVFVRGGATVEESDWTTIKRAR